MPLPQGRCIGKYTDEAKRAAIEGTVILDLIVSETGRARDIRVVSGLEHGLTDAAIAAIKECRFTPGEKDGTPVAVRVRGFKIRFLLQNDE
jgi:periplasmic protein TonB